ncbi:hypothetical protein AVEN_155499-1 [Araneus ventricosus]|uniref:Uncharacterized protein n=1 Tax=Araneus ventricosus TaxID=182803 RepID=A0A4Y2X3D2_ARAVE|nr:hypothetical protein AVEN_155499-1 [Araneus ventricosus]
MESGSDPETIGIRCRHFITRLPHLRSLGEAATLDQSPDNVWIQNNFGHVLEIYIWNADCSDPDFLDQEDSGLEDPSYCLHDVQSLSSYEEK